MLNNIQALRGIAALLVLFHHSMPHFRAMDLHNSVYEFIGKFGFLGVDIFFVISGFVMAKTTYGNGHGLDVSKIFIIKRLLRIFLGFWPVFVLALIYYKNFNLGFLSNKSIVQSFFLVNANMFDLVIAPAWSLTYELFFYAIVAVMLLSKKVKYHYVFLLFFILIIVKNSYIMLGENRIIDFFFSSKLLEFFGGYLLFQYSFVLYKPQFIKFIIVMVIITFLIATQVYIAYGYMRVLTFGVFAFALVWLLLSLERNKIFVMKGILSKIGDSSYTLYLTHTVLLGMFASLGLRSYLVNNNFALIGFILIILFIILFSYIFYIAIEKPLYLFAKKKTLDT